MTSTDLGHPSEPGDYGVDGAVVSVDQRHVDIWREHPGRTFRTVLLTRAGDTRIRLALSEPSVSD